MSPLARAARALAAAGFYCRNVQGFRYGNDFVIRDCNLPGPRQEIFRSPNDDAMIREWMDAAHNRIKVRAVVAAIRSPSAAMVEAAEAVELEAPDNATSRDVLIAQYAAMLDALLEEPADG